MKVNSKWFHFIYRPTMRCNLNCSYCYLKNCEFEEEIITGKMAGEWFKKFVIENNIRYHIASISGGEPLLKADDVIEFFQIVKTLPSKPFGKYGSSLFTNGLLLDKSMSRFLDGIRIRIHVDRGWFDKIADKVYDFDLVKFVFILHKDSISDLEWFKSVIREFPDIPYQINLDYYMEDELIPKIRELLADFYNTVDRIYPDCFEYVIIKPGGVTYTFENRALCVLEGDGYFKSCFVDFNSIVGRYPDLDLEMLHCKIISDIPEQCKNCKYKDICRRFKCEFRRKQNLRFCSVYKVVYKTILGRLYGIS